MATSRIGIGIPCLMRDKEMLEEYCLPSINRMNPAPHEVLIYFNNGVDGGLLELRDKIFDELFIKRKCDIVLVIDVDFYFFNKSILNKVRNDMVVSFVSINYRPISSIFKILQSNMVRNAWTGCYSMPKIIYYKYIKGKWDGGDGSIHICLDNNFESTRIPRHMLINRDANKLIINAMKQKKLSVKIMKLSRLIPF